MTAFDDMAAQSKSLARRLIGATAAVGIAITLFTTGLQLYAGYNADLTRIKSNFLQIRSGHLGSLAEGVWRYESGIVQLGLNALALMPDMEYLEIRTPDGKIWTAGERTSERVIVETMPLVRVFKGRPETIAELTAVASVDQIHERLFGKAAEAAVYVGAWVFLVAGFMFLIFQRLITRHLHAIAQFAASAPVAVDGAVLELARSAPRGGGDELDHVVHAINSMRARLAKTLADLRESKERFRHFAESSSDWLWEMDENLRFSYWSERFRDITGLDPSAYVGKTRAEMAAEDADGDHWRRHLADLATHRPIRNFTYDLKNANGDRLTVSVNGIPVFDEAENFRGYRGTATDITRQKWAEESRDTALVEAERANQAKSEFLATMSHEFRTPLNDILGFSEMLRSQYFGPLGTNKYEEYANNIFSSGEHMLALINDILDIAAIEAGKRKMFKEPVDVAEVLREAKRNVENQAAAKSITLEIDMPDDLPRLSADRRSVIQIVLNLLSNAVKFTEDGGRVVLRAAASGRWLSIAVQDTGIGIPADKLPRVTEPFSQSHSDPHLAQGGTGLGLSIVKSLAVAHAGSIDIVSEVGIGTTVTVTLPLGGGESGKDNPQPPLPGLVS